MELISQPGIAPQESFYSVEYDSVKIIIGFDDGYYRVILNPVNGTHKWDKLEYARYASFEAAGEALKTMIAAKDKGIDKYFFPVDVPSSLSYSESHGTKPSWQDRADEYDRIINNAEWLMQKARDIGDAHIEIVTYDLKRYATTKQREINGVDS